MTIMRQITNSIKCLIVFGIWLLGFNTLSACNIKLKIVYTQADLRTIFDITPELFDKGLISHSLDSIIVVSDMKFSKFFDTINSLKKTSEIHPSINVRAKIIFYLNEQILNTYYLGMFYIYCQNGIYEVNEEFRNMINAIIKKVESCLCIDQKTLCPVTHTRVTTNTLIRVFIITLIWVLNGEGKK